MPKTVFLHPCDSFLGRVLGKTFAESGYSVHGACFNPAEALPWVDSTYKLGEDDAAERQLLLVADVVVYELAGYEGLARSAVVQMGRQPGGKEQVFIGISSPLAWAATPLPEASTQQEAPLPRLASVEPSAADLQGLHTAASTAAVDLSSTQSRSLSDKVADSRRPGATGRSLWECEYAILRGQRGNRLRTYVVCPGLLYGAGEDDGTFHPLCRSAWEGHAALHTYGPGTNHLPTIHVSDLAAFIAAAASGTPDQQYLLATDGSCCTQLDIMSAISKALGNGEVQTGTVEDLFLMPTEQHTIGNQTLLGLNLVLQCSQLPDSAGYRPRYAGGLPAHAPVVAAEYLSARNLQPLRVVLWGPPAAGKSLLAHRLAHLYGVQCLSVQDILHAVQLADAELQKAIQAELSGKEARVSSKHLAALFRLLVSAQPAAKRGFVLDGWPRTEVAARFAFMDLAACSEAELLELQKDAAAAAAQKAKDPKAAAKAAAASKPGAKGAPLDAFEVPAGMKAVRCPGTAPTHVIQIEADEAELLARVKALEAHELEAARAAAGLSADTAAAAGKGGKHAKGPEVVVKGHNNQRDFARRMEAWVRMQQEDAEGLEKRVTQLRERWERQQAEQAAERARLEAEANTLKAKRQRMKQMAATAALSSTITDAPPSLATTGALTAAEMVEQDAASADTSAGDASAQSSPPGPDLPSHGGALGAMMEAGAQLLSIRNPTKDAGVALDPVAQSALRYPFLEAQLTQFIGQPRNFDGFPPEPVPPPPPVDTEALEREQRRQEAQAALAARKAQLQEMQRAAMAEREKSRLQHTTAGSPVQTYLMHNVMPVITEALEAITRTQPRDPFLTLADYLVAAAERQESQYTDPYTNPRYEIQKEKQRAKAEREAAREAAAAAKAEREAAARAAQAEQQLSRQLSLGASEPPAT